MRRPIVYDIAHLRRRTLFSAPSGIDRVDLLFGRHFSASDELSASIRYGRNYPKVFPSSRLGELVQQAESGWKEHAPLEEDRNYRQTARWLAGEPAKHDVLTDKERGPSAWDEVKLYFQRFYPSDPKRRPVPQSAVYLNIAQHATEHGYWFEWLTKRKDVQAVFFLHDLIPLDFPEYWPEQHRELFERRVETIFRYASALITSSASVRERALAEMDARKVAKVPIYCAHLPSPTEGVSSHAIEDEALRRQPYFVVLGTIEPRKNHVLLLNVWRRLATRGGPVPKLVAIGSRGWENENVIDMLDRSPSIAEHIWEIAGLSNAGISKLLSNARALLMPSFAEGYGLPIVEALSVGTPVVASDIPVFREIAQGRATFLDPIDGLGWSEAILSLADAESQQSRAAKEQAMRFRPMTSKVYFEGLEVFLRSL